MTGTTVNPLFRAVYSSQAAKQKLTLLVPWLCKSNEELVYPTNLNFTSPEELVYANNLTLCFILSYQCRQFLYFCHSHVYFSDARRSIIPGGEIAINLYHPGMLTLLSWKNQNI